MSKYRLFIDELESENGTIFNAKYEGLKGLIGTGITEEDAIADLKENYAIYIDAMEEAGLEIPKPKEKKRPSGKFALRMPISMQDKLNSLAEEEKVSVNSLIINSISMMLGEHKASSNIKDFIKLSFIEALNDFKENEKNINFKIQ